MNLSAYLIGKRQFLLTPGDHLHVGSMDRSLFIFQIKHKSLFFDKCHSNLILTIKLLLAFRLNSLLLSPHFVSSKLELSSLLLFRIKDVSLEAEIVKSVTFDLRFIHYF